MFSVQSMYNAFDNFSQNISYLTFIKKFLYKLTANATSFLSGSVYSNFAQGQHKGQEHFLLYSLDEMGEDAN